jgi:hypothetical protein
MEFEGSLLRSEELATGPYPEPDDSNLASFHTIWLFIQIFYSNSSCYTYQSVVTIDKRLSDCPQCEPLPMHHTWFVTICVTLHVLI